MGIVILVHDTRLRREVALEQLCSSIVDEIADRCS